MKIKDITEIKKEKIKLLKCPECGEEMSINTYWRANKLGCDYFCYNCWKHVRTKDMKMFSDEDVVRLVSD